MPDSSAQEPGTKLHGAPRARKPLRSLFKLKPMRVFSLFLILAGSPLSSWGASTSVQPGYEFSGSPNPEYLLEELRAQTGRKYWVRKPETGQSPKNLFCDSKESPPFKEKPLACPGEPYGAKASEQFTIEDVLIAKSNPAYSWFKIRFESGKTAYISAQDFKENRYAEGKISTALYGIDFAINNSGWIFDEYPASVLDRRRAQARNDPKREQEQLEKERVMRLSILHIGMTAQQVLNSSWGKPDAVNTTIEGPRRLEQWIYGAGNTLYFENDRLHSIQAFKR